MNEQIVNELVNDSHELIDRIEQYNGEDFKRDYALLDDLSEFVYNAANELIKV